jgi:2-amino-4-hydroxy-6-hydroxymethyldihydropteridine diphosphokinase
MTRAAYFGLGSNLGDRWWYLQEGVAALVHHGSDPALSRVYETAPVGGPAGQGRYLNCVLRISTDSEPLALLALANRIEADAGRVRAERFGPRTLDVDVLTIEGFTSADPRLTIPHPRMSVRSFVLAPLEELDPGLVPDGWRAQLGGDDVVNGEVRPVGVMLNPGQLRTRERDQ